MHGDQDDERELRESEQVLLEVLDALEGASVDARRRRIVWPDGARLSIDETANRIHSDSGAPLARVHSHVVGWLEIIYDPEGLDEQQMEEFERLIELWIAPYDQFS